VIDDVPLGQFACKRIPVGDSRSHFERIIIEVRLLQKIPHRNLVAYHWTWLEDHQPAKFGPSIPCLWILQDYCNGGDLQSYVLGPTSNVSSTEAMKARLRRKSRGEASPTRVTLGSSRLSFDEIFSFFKDITTGLHHLHSKGYIHRDLKPSNCLLQHDDGRTRVLISDFGEVQLAGDNRRSTGATGTVAYLAPEALRQSPDGSFHNFTTKSDIFSLGMIVYFMCFGRLPYANADGISEEDEDLDQLRAEITRWPGFDDETRPRSDLPERLYRYLRRLLSVNPDDRPGTDEILSSIKGGISLGDANLAQDTRLPSIDHSGRQSRRPTLLAAPGTRPMSRSNAVNDSRSQSPMKQLPTESDPLIPPEASTAVDLRRTISIPPKLRSETAHPSPRLLLPPPPPRQDGITQTMIQILQRPETLSALRTGFFLAKMASCVAPCGGHAVQPWIFYPLMTIAAIDLGALHLRLRYSIIFLLLHIGVVVAAMSQNVLCLAG
jgi:serine/threonine protein kinase